MPNRQFFTTQQLADLGHIPCRCNTPMDPEMHLTREDGRAFQVIQRWRCPICGRTFTSHNTWTAPTVEQLTMEVT